MSKMTRQKYSKEFKLDAISLVLKQKNSSKKVALNLNINASMLRRWIREYQSDNLRRCFSW